MSLGYDVSVMTSCMVVQLSKHAAESEDYIYSVASLWGLFVSYLWCLCYDFTKSNQKQTS